MPATAQRPLVRELIDLSRISVLDLRGANVTHAEGTLCHTSRGFHIHIARSNPRSQQHSSIQALNLRPKIDHDFIQRAFESQWPLVVIASGLHGDLDRQTDGSRTHVAHLALHQKGLRQRLMPVQSVGFCAEVTALTQQTWRGNWDAEGEVLLLARPRKLEVVGEFSERLPKMDVYGGITRLSNQVTNSVVITQVFAAPGESGGQSVRIYELQLTDDTIPDGILEFLQK